MLYPARQNLKMKTGGSFDAVFAFYQDDAQTEPLSLLGYTATFQVNTEGASPSLTVTSPPSVLVNGSGGFITISLTADQLSAFNIPQSIPYYLSVANGSHLYYLATGSIVFTSPLSPVRTLLANF